MLSENRFLDTFRGHNIGPMIGQICFDYTLQAY